MFELPHALSWQPLTLPHTWAGQVDAHGNVTRYRVFVRLPDCPPPPGGFPVMYVLDAGDLFAGVAEVMRRAGRRAESTGIGPALLVGIDHMPSSGPSNAARRRDYT